MMYNISSEGLYVNYLKLTAKHQSICLTKLVLSRAWSQVSRHKVDHRGRSLEPNQHVLFFTQYKRIWSKSNLSFSLWALVYKSDRPKIGPKLNERLISKTQMGLENNLMGPYMPGGTSFIISASPQLGFKP